MALTVNMLAQNPIIRDQFSADPTARVDDGKVYVYPSHDILAVEGKDHIRLKFQAAPRSTAGAVYFIRLVEQ
jgi:hypothetical protein